MFLNRFPKILDLFVTCNMFIFSLLWVVLFVWFYVFFQFSFGTETNCHCIGSRVVRTYMSWTERNNPLYCPWPSCNSFSENSFQGASAVTEYPDWNSGSREWRLCWNYRKHFASISAPYFIDPRLSCKTTLLVRPGPFSIFSTSWFLFCLCYYLLFGCLINLPTLVNLNNNHWSKYFANKILLFSEFEKLRNNSHIPCIKVLQALSTCKSCFRKNKHWWFFAGDFDSFFIFSFLKVHAIGTLP